MRTQITHPRDRLFSRSELEVRGWNKGMMDRHLPEPDDYRDNPHYKCAAPMKFWLKTTVKKIERRKSFNEDLEKSKHRSESAKKASAKAQKTRFDNQEREMKAVLAEALREGLMPANGPSLTAVKNVLLDQFREPTERNMVNCIRHEYTDYEYYAQFLHGGMLEEYRAALMGSIAKRYKKLAPACREQQQMWTPCMFRCRGRKC